ncbi:hypothetical protein V1478_010398 [Vespula squamosa]|uniref:Uncharacterized protein n=1 Tax=Vespula squamosa TaxID=30214 RepID=A0ABD2AHN8_VESSQ
MHSYADASGDFLKTESDMEDALTKEKTNESSWRSALLLDSNRFREPEAGPRQLANFQAAGKGEDNWRKRFFTMDSPLKKWVGLLVRNYVKPTNEIESFLDNTVIRFIYGQRFLIYDLQFLRIIYDRDLENANKKLRCCSVKSVNHDEQF